MVIRPIVMFAMIVKWCRGYKCTNFYNCIVSLHECEYQLYVYNSHRKMIIRQHFNWIRRWCERIKIYTYMIQVYLLVVGVMVSMDISEIDKSIDNG